MIMKLLMNINIEYEYEWKYKDGDTNMNNNMNKNLNIKIEYETPWNIIECLSMTIPGLWIGLWKLIRILII